MAFLLLKQVLLGIAGLSAGMVTAAGVFAFITAIGLVQRLVYGGFVGCLIMSLAETLDAFPVRAAGYGNRFPHPAIGYVG